MHDMIEGLLDTFKSTAMSKDVSLKNSVEDETSVWADYNTVATIFRNLINNALKFSLEGGTIEVLSEISAGCTELTVRDTGVGIEPERLKSLFELKEKKTTYGTQGEKGVGLGLQLVQEFTKPNLEVTQHQVQAVTNLTKEDHPTTTNQLLATDLVVEVEPVNHHQPNTLVVQHTNSKRND